jgi:hypothetical protein
MRGVNKGSALFQKQAKIDDFRALYRQGNKRERNNATTEMMGVKKGKFCGCEWLSVHSGSLSSLSKLLCLCIG